VTAGPTFEAIDPVRFIGNHSSGKMGFAIAAELARQGAEVVLVSGPGSLSIEQGAGEIPIRRIDVTTAEEMLKVCLNNFSKCTITVMCAAVADYKPAKTQGQKIKKKREGLVLELVPTTDILAELGKRKSVKQRLVGFALETNNALSYAKAKLKKKKLDLIVLNSLQDKGAGFKGDTNKVTLVDKYNKTVKFELKDKKEVAEDILEKIVSLLPR
jgi:phosphopantothenoylcysteine decarboxylase/phosphopantothenate--cysteine ligase